MTAESQPSASGRRALLLALGAFLLSLILFWPSVSYEFVDVDDPEFVSANSQVLEGLNPSTIKWALTEYHAANWVPVTFMSLMLDSSVFGTEPRGYHLVNVILHALNAALLLWLFWRASGQLWPAVFLALLFAVHPMRVESVAWIAERKDVLSTLWWLITTLLWVEWTRRPSPRLYILVLVSFVIGLMAKGMLVTLPFTLLLLDEWVLRREISWRQRIVEKLPLFGLAFLVAGITFVAQRSGGAVTELGALTFGDRLGNAIVGFSVYLGRLVWPMDLAYLYPHPSFVPPFEGWSAAAVGGSLALLIAVTGAGLWLYRRGVRYPLVGWLWYLGTLVPVIGLVQVGSQANADRYMYIPQIGLLWIVCFGAADLIKRRASLRNPVVALGVIVAVASVVLTVQNLPHWKNSEALFRRAVEVTEHNGMAMNGLGATLAASGRIDEARPYLHEAVTLMPRLAEARTNLGIILMQDGDAGGAIAQHREALKLRPDYAAAHINLGNALAATGQLEEGARHLQQGISLDPFPWQPYYNLAGIRYQQGNVDLARRLLNEALRRAPDPATQMRIRNAMR